MSNPTSSTPKPPSKRLLAWLDAQAKKLKNLVKTGWKLQSACLLNAKEQGTVLSQVRRRLKGTSVGFDEWVKENTDIGVSTAYLWCDVAEWWDDLQDLVKDSNPLEFGVRQIRDRIRDLRQSQGKGKPGSGRTKAVADPVASPADGAETHFEEEADEADAPDACDDDFPDEQVQQEAVNNGRKTSAQNIAESKYKKLMDRFKPGGDMHKGGDTKKATLPNQYRLTIVTPAKADLERFGELLPSPITDFNAHSVFGWVRPQDIDNTLAAVGKALTVAQPKKVRVVVEL